jgi:signal transduction histidine kinase
MKKPIILCVDDERTILNRLKVELKEIVGGEYIIEIAESGEDALEIIAELLADNYEIPLAISDYQMPNLKGDELLHRLHLITPKTLKIMLTGQANLEAIGNAVNYANLYRYIAKPWESADLNLTIKEALYRYTQDQQLTQFYADLEAKIVERTRELQEKNEALLKLNQEKNEFLSMAAHDLKNPLSAIQGLAQHLQEDFEGLPKAVVKAAQMIELSSRKMVELVKKLLDVNAIEAGKMNVSCKVLNVLPVLKALVEVYTKRAQEKNITVSFHYVKKIDYHAMVDEIMLHQVLDNLISNAIKYSPLGKSVTVRVNQTEGKVRCEVQDEGPGLSEEDRLQLFGKFTRLRPRPTGGEHSSGLGLFIVKKLVVAMSGNVWCESELGKGTTFIVEFPLSE